MISVLTLVRLSDHPITIWLLSRLCPDIVQFLRLSSPISFVYECPCAPESGLVRGNFGEGPQIERYRSVETTKIGYGTNVLCDCSF